MCMILVVFFGAMYVPRQWRERPEKNSGLKRGSNPDA